MSKTGKIIGIVVIILFLIVVFTLSNNKKPSAPKEIGVIVPLSGQLASMAEGIKRSMDLASPKNLKISYEDDQCDSKRAISAYNALKLRGIKLFYVGCSGSVLALAPLAKQNGDLIVTAYSGSSEIRKTGDEVIRFNPDALSVLDSMKEYIENAPYKKYAVLFEFLDYSKSVADGLSAILGEKVGLLESYASADPSFKTQITKLKDSSIEAIILLPVSDKAAQIILKEMGDLGINKPIIGEVNLCDYPFKPSDFGLHGTCWKAELTTPGAIEFETMYKDTYGFPSQYAFYDAETYDVTIILDKLLENKELDIPELKKSILAGVTGKVTDYSFEPNGEVIGTKYLKQVEF